MHRKCKEFLKIQSLNTGVWGMVTNFFLKFGFVKLNYALILAENSFLSNAITMHGYKIVNNLTV